MLPQTRNRSGLNMEQFTGSWKSVRVENLEDYMTALGVEDSLKAIAHAVQLFLTFSQEDDTVVLNLEANLTSQISSFKLNEEFHKTTGDGRDCKMLVCLEGDKLIEVAKWDDSESTTIYEVQDGQLIKTLKYQDAVAVYTFEKA